MTDLQTKTRQVTEAVSTGGDQASVQANEPAVYRTPADHVDVPQPAASGPDLDAPEYYLNRELTWLNFNFRVLREAEDTSNPLLERLRFVSIVSSNIDEFFMKRIGGLKQQLGAGIQERTIDGRTPGEQIAECHELIRKLEKLKRKALARVIEALGEHDIAIVPFEALNKTGQEHIRSHFVENIFPLLTPQSTDPAHPFPFVSNLSLNLLVTLHYPEDPATSVARVKVPVGTGIPRFLQLPDSHTFVPLESVVAHNLDLLFPGMEIETCHAFRITRNANTEIEEENAEDLLAVIETGLRNRRFAPIVRLEVATGMDDTQQGMLASNFGLQDPSDSFTVDGMLAMADLAEIADLKIAELRYLPHQPADHPALLNVPSIFHAVRQAGSILLHHPYQSFDTSVGRFIKEASIDPKVRAIKMTLYRTSPDSTIIRHLREAARNGKQVAVVLELKASFDEAKNIRWANHLEEMGVHVTYGVIGLKTHCKAVLVVRQDDDVLRRYTHTGTGNYHEVTARQYTDLGLLTCDKTIGVDLTELFNYLTTGYKPKRSYSSILPAPKTLKQAVLAKIEREIASHLKNGAGHIQFKTNALEDGDVTRALYQAASAGVKIDLFVRDTCRLRPGIENLSESVTVLSIVGRFLEHSRVFYFRNNGKEEYYIGSADLMKRNLESRVETMIPIQEGKLRKQLRMLLDACSADRRNAWEMQPDGSYIKRTAKQSDATNGLQQRLMDWADKQARDATRLKKRKVRGVQTLGK